jgi:hypothetical protein
MARSNLAGAFDGRLSFGGRPALLLVDVVPTSGWSRRRGMAAFP